MPQECDFNKDFNATLWKEGIFFNGTVVLIGNNDKRRANLLKHKILCLLEEMAEDERRFFDFLSMIK